MGRLLGNIRSRARARVLRGIEVVVEDGVGFDVGFIEGASVNGVIFLVVGLLVLGYPLSAIDLPLSLVISG